MRIVTLSLALLLVVAGAALSAPRVGSVDDPVDVPPPTEGPARSDARRVAVTYEPDDGSLVVTLELHEPLGTTAYPHESVWVDLTFGIGAFTPDGVCAVPTRGVEGRAGDLRFHGQIDSNGPPGAITNQFRTTIQMAGSGREITGAIGAISADRRTITWLVGDDADLAARDYRCVGDIEMPYSYHDVDLVAPFALADTAPPPAAAAPPPSGAVAGHPPAARPSPRDRAAPRVRFRFGSRSLRQLRASGLTAPVRCTEWCSVRARLLLRPATARALRTSRLLGTSATRTVIPGRRAAARVYLSRGAKRALAGRRAVRAVLEVTATDRAGNRRTATRSAILRR